MTQLSWHTRIATAIQELADDHQELGYRNVSPRRVYFRTADDRGVFYNPDGLWVSGRFAAHVTIWEAESTYQAKHIVGGMALADLVSPHEAELYPYLESGEGDPASAWFRKPMEFGSIWGGPEKEIITPEDRCRIRPSGVSFILIVPDEERETYIERYFELVAEANWNQFEQTAIVSCAASSVPDAKRSLMMQGELDWLWRHPFRRAVGV